MRITKVYTRTGDQGRTQLVGGELARKDDARIEAYGTVDELNAVLGVCRQELGALPAEDQVALDASLARIQDDLFNVGTDLATPPEVRWEGMHRVGDAEVTWLEATLDGWNDTLPPLSEFVLPGGGRAGACLHHARTVARRAERRALAVCDLDPGLTDGALRYLNRLSDLLFVAARWAAHRAQVPEVTWRNPSKWRR